MRKTRSTHSLPVMRGAVLLLALAAAFQIASRVLIRHKDASTFPVKRFAIGDTLPPVSFRSAGRTGPLNLLGPKKTSLEDIVYGCAILIFFRSTCPACEKIVQSWRYVDSLQVAGTPLPVRWIGTAMDPSAEEWIQRHNLGSAYIADVTTWRTLGVRFVPVGYIVDSNKVLLARALITRKPALELPAEVERSITARCFPAPEDHREKSVPKRRRRTAN